MGPFSRDEEERRRAIQFRQQSTPIRITAQPKPTVKLSVNETPQQLRIAQPQRQKPLEVRPTQNRIVNNSQQRPKFVGVQQRQPAPRIKAPTQPMPRVATKPPAQNIFQSAAGVLEDFGRVAKNAGSGLVNLGGKVVFQPLMGTYRSLTGQSARQKENIKAAEDLLNQRVEQAAEYFKSGKINEQQLQEITDKLSNDARALDKEKQKYGIESEINTADDLWNLGTAIPREIARGGANLVSSVTGQKLDPSANPFTQFIFGDEDLKGLGDDAKKAGAETAAGAALIGGLFVAADIVPNPSKAVKSLFRLGRTAKGTKAASIVDDIADLAKFDEAADVRRAMDDVQALRGLTDEQKTRFADIASKADDTNVEKFVKIVEDQLAKNADEAARTVIHASGDNIYSRVTLPQYAKLFDETENIVFKDRAIHLSKIDRPEIKNATEVPQADLVARVPEIAETLKQVDQVQPEDLAKVQPVDSEVSRVADNTAMQQTAVPEAIATPESTPTVQRVAQEARTAPQTIEELNQSIESAIEAANSLKGEGIAKKIKRQAFDPYSALARMDRKYAKAIGGDLPRSQSLEALADVSHAMRGATGVNAAIERMRQFGLVDVLQKYTAGRGGLDNPAAKAFRRYQNFKFALEVFDKNNLKLLVDEAGNAFDIDTMRQWVAQYEATNPSAFADNAVFKRWADDIVDRLVQSGAMDPEAGRWVKESYQNYVPLNRVIPDELATPDAPMRPIAGMGKQTVIQNLTGGKLPISEDWDVFINRGHNAEAQIAKARLDQLIRRRAEDGYLDEARIITTKDQVIRSKVLREQLGELVDLRNKLTNEAQKVVSNRKVSTVKTNAAQAEVSKKAHALLRKTVDDVDARAAIDDLSDDALAEILIGAVDEGNYRVSKKLIKEKAKRDALNNSIEDIRSQVAYLKQNGSDIRSEIAELAQDPTTGKQIITTLDNGVPVKTEISPELATVFKGLDDQKLSVIARAFRTVTAPFRAAFTGAFNPVFAAFSYVFYDAPMGYVNSPNGLRTLADPRAWYESFKGFNSNAEFQKILRQNGAQTQTASLIPLNSLKDAQNLAAEGKFFRKLTLLSDWKNLKAVAGELDALGGKLGNSTRTRIARATYQKALSKGMTEADAIAEAVWSFNNVMPNYARSSRLLREIDAVLPYTAASVAGTRSYFKAVRNSPVKTLSKTAAVAAPGVVLVAHNLSSDIGEEFYQDMVDSGQTWVLDNNFIMVLPGAKRDPRTGEWTGIVKIPVPPEFREINASMWRAARDTINGQSETSPATYAKSMFDFMTGGVFDNTDNPFLQTVQGLQTGVNPRYGSDIVPEEMQDLPLEEQQFASTSELAKTIAKAIGTSPLNVQFVINQFGAGGRLVSGKTDIVDEAVNRLVGARGDSDAGRFWDAVGNYRTQIKDIDDRKAYDTLHSKDPVPGILDSAEKATIYLNRPAVLEADRKLDEWNRQNGDPGNPLFDLKPDELQKVLVYRQAKMLNAGKQTYDKNGAPLFTALGLDEQWYETFRDSETEFYDAINANSIERLEKEIKDKDLTNEQREEKKKELRERKEDKEDYTTFSGGKKPQASPELQELLDYYYTLPKGTGQRSNMLRAYPEILEFWEKSDGFVNRERQAIGLKPISEDEDGYGKYGKYGSGSGGVATPRIFNMGQFTASDIPQVKLSSPNRNFNFGVQAPKGAPSNRKPVIRLER